MWSTRVMIASMADLSNSPRDVFSAASISPATFSIAWTAVINASGRSQLDCFVCVL